MSSLVSNRKFAILAPVPESYMGTALSQIYPTHKKVSFGSNVVGEINTARNQFLTAKRYQGNVPVYFYVGGHIKLKATLLDEFLFYDEITPHPEPWGLWNIAFKSYYTVTDIEECDVPLSKFRSLKTGKVVEGVRKPLRVIDPE